MTTLANQCPPSNTQDDFSVVIHGPTWRNTMPLDAHALTVVLPFLRSAGWEIEADERTSRINVISPWSQEAAS